MLRAGRGGAGQAAGCPGQPADIREYSERGEHEKQLLHYKYVKFLTVRGGAEGNLPGTNVMSVE